MKRRRLLKKAISASLAIIIAVAAFSTMSYAASGKWSGIAEGDVLVKDTVTRITDGVTEHEVITNNEKGTDQRIDYLCEVKPSDSLKAVAGYGNMDATKWSLTRTTDHAKAYEKKHPGETVVAAINADFFNMANGAPMGALVMEGEKYHDANGRWYFGVTKDNKPVISNDSDLSNLQMAVGGDQVLVRDGKTVTESNEYGSIRYSRTAIGIKKDGSIVTFVTYGHKPPISNGRTYKEIGEMLSKEGCVTALALDGGGSSTYAGRPEGTDKLVVRNTPGDGAERAVSSSVMFVSTKEKTGVFDHAALTPNDELYTPNSTVKVSAQGVDNAGFPMDLPEGVKYTLAEQSKELGTIDAASGEFKANDKQGKVTVNLEKDGKVIGETTFEIIVPDKIQFSNDEISLAFDQKSDLGIKLKNKERELHFNADDIKWSTDNDKLGRFEGNEFISSDSESSEGTITATSAYDGSVKGSIKVIVGKLPTVVWDFEDKKNEQGEVTETAEDYYIGNADKKGILTHSNYRRGGKESIEIAQLQNDEPVRFGSKSLKVNYDFRECGEVTEGACIGTTEKFEVPGTPTAIGAWVYAPEGVGIKYDGEGSQAGFWLRGQVLDGSGKLVPYDFTLEPKHPDVSSGKVQPGIYWEGWKYVEADLTKIQAPYKINPGMTFRLMFVHGTKMGTRTANSVYFDNLQFVYGTNVDDIDNPKVTSLTLNGKKLEDDAVVKDDNITIEALFEDVQNKYTSGIDGDTVRMYIDGENVVNNKDKYNYGYDTSGNRAQLSDLKLTPGEHTLTVAVRDKFGIETTVTKHFTVERATPDENTKVRVVPKESKAVLGREVNLQIKASDDTVKENTTEIKLGNLFKDYEVVFSDDFDGDVSYSKLNKSIKIKATRKESSAKDADHLIATLKVKIPTTLKEDNKFTYTVRNGKFTTTSDYYDTYSTKEKSLDIAATYTIKADPVIIGGKDAVINVKTAEGKPAADVSVYLEENDELVGKTDENGALTTDRFSKTSGEYKIYARDAENGLSFVYKLKVYDPHGDKDGKADAVRFNITDDPVTQKNITWLSSPLSEAKQQIQYRTAGSEEWKTAEATTKKKEFTTNGHKIANINAVKLTGLTPDTTYEYQVGSEGAYSDVAEFTTDKAGRKNSRFFLIGDIQDPNKKNLESIVNILNKDKYNFGVQIGDAIDNAADLGDWKEVGDLLGAKGVGSVDMINVMGNHEYYGDANADIAAAMYNNPKTREGGYYSIRYGNIYIATINFATTKGQIREAADWLVKDAVKSNATWKILCTHQPPYFTNSTGGNDVVNELLPDAVEKAGIDVVFSGHDHTAGRTMPLKGGKVDEEHGIVYYLCGAAGSKRYPITTGDKFNFKELFNSITADYGATYLTASSDSDEMTIEMYDVTTGTQLDSLTLQSKCKKGGHDVVYDPAKKKLTCAICKEKMEEYTGTAKDKKGNEYYFLKGKMQTGWIPEGEDWKYYNDFGIREKVTKKTTREGTCVLRKKVEFKAESGAKKTVEYKDFGGGHEYKETDGKFVCTVCGHTRIDMKDCKVKLSYDKCTYTGKKRTPKVTVTDPNGKILVYTGNKYEKDFSAIYSDNIEVGKAQIKLHARRPGVYVNKNEWRGDYAGDVYVSFEIRPDDPTYATATVKGGKATVKWKKPELVKDVTYNIYHSTNGKKWNRVKTTGKLSCKVTGLNKKSRHYFRINSVKTGTDGKKYESIDGINTGLFVNIKYNENHKPELSWNRISGAEYKVYRATSKNGKMKRLRTTKRHSFTDTSATPSYTYYYKVVANDKVSSSLYAAKVKPKAPKISAVYGKDGKTKVTWKSVTGAKKYVVYRATSKDGTYYKKLTTTEKRYVDTSAKPGKTYYYKAKTIAKNGKVSAYSNVVAKKCKK